MRWTPDGRQIVFTGFIGRTASLYRMAPDGTRLRRLAPVRTTPDAAVFSPDGRLMAYNDRRGTMVRPVAGGRARRLLTGLWVKAWASRPR
jgi:Tol biopolymer transport system component